MGRKLKTDLDMPQIFILIIVAFLLVGVLIGSVLANTLEEGKHSLLSSHINQYIITLDNPNYVKSSAFFETFVKYEKIVVFIWLLAFIPSGAIVSLGIILSKGMAFGFTTSFFVMEFGTQGIVYVATLYLIQNLFLIPAYIWTAYNNLAYVSKLYSHSVRLSAKFSKNEMLEYFLVLLTSSSFVVLASLIEIFII